jgi:hypothetical protein
MEYADINGRRCVIRHFFTFEEMRAMEGTTWAPADGMDRTVILGKTLPNEDVEYVDTQCNKLTKDWWEFQVRYCLVKED